VGRVPRPAHRLGDEEVPRGSVDARPEAAAGEAPSAAARFGAIVGTGYFGGGLVGSTTFRFGPKSIVVPGVGFGVLRAKPEISSERASARFVQTVGGRAGLPAPLAQKSGVVDFKT
jgi:hypothetical protein